MLPPSHLKNRVIRIGFHP